MLYDVIEAANDSVRQWLEENAIEWVSASKAGLDERCGHCWITGDAVVVRTDNRQRFDYYGGFEYVSKDYIATVGDYTIYFAEDERIQDCIEFHRCRAEQVEE